MVELTTGGKLSGIFAAEDPYAKAGLFESVVIRAFKQVI